MIRFSLPVVAAVAVFVAAAPASAQTQPDAASTLEQFVTAVNHNDVQGQLALLTDNAIVIGGPCSGPPANGECVGRPQVQQAMQNNNEGISVTLSDVQVIGDGNTVTFKTNEVFPLPAEVTSAGIHRMVELGTAVISNGQLDRLALVPDVTDPQTVQLQRLFAEMGPPPASPGTTVTSDGQSLASQPAATQAQFRAAYGDKAAETWAAQHQASLPK